jgi:hypothetical protein
MFQGAPGYCTPTNARAATGAFVGSMNSSMMGTGTLSLFQDHGVSFSVVSPNRVVGQFSGGDFSGEFQCTY